MTVAEARESNLYKAFRKDALDALANSLLPHLHGLSVFETTFSSCCITDFYYSYWPNRLLDVVDDELRRRARHLSRHGIHFYVPLLLKIVLNEARNREDIPRTICELRKAYEKPRRQLWDILEAMWRADTIRAEELNQELERAANAIVPAIFKHRVDIVSTGMDIVPGVAGAIAGTATGQPVTIVSGSATLAAKAGNALFSHLRARIDVRGLSLAHKLSRDLRKALRADNSVFRKHFADSEIEGLGRSL